MRRLFVRSYKRTIASSTGSPVESCATTARPKTWCRKPMSGHSRILRIFAGNSSLATWLGRIAINEASGRLRRRRSTVEWTSLPPGTLEAQIIQFPLSAASQDPEKSMAQREIQHVVEHAIDDLPEAFRIVFITRVIEGMNVEETAEILGLKPETVKTRLHRARAMLRDNVEKKIGPVVMEAFPFAGKRCERLTDAVLKRLGVSA